MESQEIPVGIAGVRGYKGTEAARLIARHPAFRLRMVASDVIAGGTLRDIDPDLERDGDAQAVGHNDTVSAAVDNGVQLMFLSTRPVQCARLAAELISRGIRVLDLSGAHVIADPGAQFQAYGFLPTDAGIAASAVYGLTEHTDPAALRAAALVANPTSYATVVLLALKPLAVAGLLDPHGIVVDVKAGTTASGRKARMSLLFSELAQNCYAEKIERHPHAPEILERLIPLMGPETRLTLTSHIIPITRGQLATCYLKTTGDEPVEVAAERVRAVFAESYARSPFVHLVDRGESVDLRAVVGTNRCVIGVSPDPYGGRVVVVCAIDNLLKGTAGQAIQNANLMFGLPETTALELGTGGRP